MFYPKAFSSGRRYLLEGSSFLCLISHHEVLQLREPSRFRALNPADLIVARRRGDLAASMYFRNTCALAMATGSDIRTALRAALAIFDEPPSASVFQVFLARPLLSRMPFLSNLMNARSVTYVAWISPLNEAPRERKINSRDPRNMASISHFLSLVRTAFHFAESLSTVYLDLSLIREGLSIT